MIESQSPVSKRSAPPVRNFVKRLRKALKEARQEDGTPRNIGTRGAFGWLHMGSKPRKRHKGKVAKAARRRHAANKVARRKRRINRQRQRPHTRKRR